MRHLKKTKKFHRKTSDRRAFIRNLAGELIRRGKINTTEARAKAVRPVVERLVAIAKKQDLSSRRLLISRLHSEKAVGKLMADIGPRYQNRRGGYLKITKSAKFRKRDGAKLAKIEFVRE